MIGLIRFFLFNYQCGTFGRAIFASGCFPSIWRLWACHLGLRRIFYISGRQRWACHIGIRPFFIILATLGVSNRHPAVFSINLAAVGVSYSPPAFLLIHFRLCHVILASGCSFCFINVSELGVSYWHPAVFSYQFGKLWAWHIGHSRFLYKFGNFGGVKLASGVFFFKSVWQHRACQIGPRFHFIT